MIVEGSEDVPIPSPFPFPPHYRSDIELGLKLKKLSPNQQAKFITRIANVMLLYKRYPSKDDFSNVAAEVVKKYSFLKSPIDPTVSCFFLLLVSNNILHVLHYVACMCLSYKIVVYGLYF